MNIRYTKPNNEAVHVLFTEGKLNKFSISKNGAHELSVGVGKSSELNQRKCILHIRKAIRLAREHEIKELVFDVTQNNFNVIKDQEELGRLIAENAVMAHYEFTTYKTKEKGAYQGLKTLFLEKASSKTKRGAEIGVVVAESVNIARDLANTPGGDMTPNLLANATKRALSGTTAKVTVIDKKGIEKLKMGLVLGVAKASAEPPKFIIVEYWGAGKTSKKKPLVLIGKGITFDTGGVNLKPTDSILGMNQDMSGGAAVIASIRAAAKLKLKKNVIALIPAVENAISGSALLPGDVLTSMNGKTVEITNTDAEGRLVLADALTYAERYNPSFVVDVATLTGASLVAVGTRACVVMAPDSRDEEKIRELGEKSGDYVWPLPAWEEYRSDLESKVADLLNAPGGPSTKKAGGCIQGGMFLKEFSKNFKHWVHIDMAPRMESISEDNLAHGAAGAPVRLLVRLIENS